MSQADMAKAHSTDNPAAVIVVLGEDAWQRQRTIARLRAPICAANDAFNVQRVDLAESQGTHSAMTTLLEAAQSLPMLAKRRFVHGEHLEAVSAKEHPALLAYLEAPAPTTCLVLSADKLDGRQKLTQALRRQAHVVELTPPRPQALLPWLTQEAKSLGHLLLPQAAEALLAQVGPEPGQLYQALVKLADYVDEAADIDAEAVATMVAPTRHPNIFVLTEAVAARDWAEALVAAAQLMADGEQPLVLLAMLARQVRLLAAARTTSRPQAAGLGVPPAVAERLGRQARAWSSSQLQRATMDLQRCDMALKSTGLSPRLAVERLLVQLLS